ncbi:MAG: SpoIIIAH-like family protein [Oscillospiraceae bacterium]
MSMIVGKKQIILAALVLTLGIGIYLNYSFSKSGDDFTATNATASSNKNFGDAQLVGKNESGATGTNAGNGEDTTQYFTQARLEREKSRGEAVETVQKILKDKGISDEELQEASAQAASIVKCMESEGKVENLIKAKGFTDCIVYLDGESANVVVKTDGLQADQAAQIKDILLQETNVPVENIRVTEVN